MADEKQLTSPELQMLINNKEDGYNFRKRRQQDWRENYQLYRDRVKINRLIQRQSVNVPLMKLLIRTLLKDVDDMPVLYFENLDNDKQAELFKNEYWKYTVKENNMSIQDIVDKKQVFLFGRSFDQWQIVDGKVKQTVQDPQDILLSRFADPFNIHSSRYLIHTHIFVPLSTLKRNKDYDQDKVAALEAFFASEMGIVKASDNLDMLVEKNQKMQDMGLDDVDDPVLGETYVELALHFVYRAGEKDEAKEEMEEQIFLYVEAEERETLMKKPLEKVIGETQDHYWRNHYPYVTWADDVERQDIWSDAVADIIRGANIILNTWMSQLVENRTLRSFGMQYYNSTLDDGFKPNTYNPTPWGWFPFPGDPNIGIKRVDIPDLSESLDEMSFLIGLIEKATGATATAQGAQTERKITLGEVELALGEAKERIKGMSKFYTPAWEQRGEIFIKLIEAGADKLDAVKITKQGRSTTKLYSKEIAPGDWMTAAGYRCKVWSQDEKDAKDSEKLQKQAAVKQIMPTNPKVDEIYKMNLLEFAGYSPDQIIEIMEIERQQMEAMQQAAAQQSMMGGEMGAMGGEMGGGQPTQALPAPAQGGLQA